ncbi:hypothetical protein [Polaromonas sp. UC242_47]|uniref:hypothetical protein n=1 Tax=Polaromonas sp. UC242_47 TaxID=3374626 RepID=UPI0037BA9440
MSGVLLLEQAVAYVRASFTKAQVKDVRAYAGEFSTAEMKNVSYNCPAILISLLGWKKPDEGGRLTGRHAKNHRMVAFVVTKNAKSREARMTEAMRLAEDLSALLRQWAPMAQQPYASAIQAQGVTIVDWTMSRRARTFTTAPSMNRGRRSGWWTGISAPRA